MKTLVVPEGGELPPEEELAALEAAEAEAKAAEEAAVAAAAAEHAEADAAIAEALEVEDSAGEVGLDIELDGDEPDRPRCRRARPADRCLTPRSQSLLAALAIAVVAAAALLAAAPASGGPSAQPRVTLIGDSIMASFDYVPAARRSLAKGLVLRSDSAVCRRLVAASCAFQGSTPATALDVVRAGGRALGRVVVINVGYNDWAAVYDVDRVLKALRGAGVESVVWVTLREAVRTRSCTRSRTRASVSPRAGGGGLVVADWNAYSRGQPWFRGDGLHLTTAGATGLARLLRPLVLAGASSARIHSIHTPC